MTDDPTDHGSDDEVGDVADDVVYLSDADETDDDGAESVWASVVTGAHYAFRRALGRPGGGEDGTGAG
jgi:hypothetical protein